MDCSAQSTSSPLTRDKCLLGTYTVQAAFRAESLSSPTGTGVATTRIWTVQTTLRSTGITCSSTMPPETMQAKAMMWCLLATAITCTTRNTRTTHGSPSCISMTRGTATSSLMVMTPTRMSLTPSLTNGSKRLDTTAVQTRTKSGLQKIEQNI